ncbi:MAG: methylenetetrahydrofolate reductase [Halobacteriaceae archaeon]
MTVQESAAENGTRTLLADPRYELMPFDSFGDQLAHLPEGSTVTITASPTLGLDATIEWSERAADRGWEVVPHLAARYVEDADHLDEVAGRLVDAGVTDVFVPGGDREEPVGEFSSAHDLLVALEELGYEFDDVGITGYPEGHPILSDETLAESMATKAPHATYVTTQLCFDPAAITDWIESVRDRGIDLPVEVGIPGVLEYQRLLNISQRVGVGDSLRFLKKTSGVLGFLRQLVSSRGTYQPDDLVDAIDAAAADPAMNISGLHVYTFNEAKATEDWRRDRLADL